jgi:hypothetical protein
VISSAVQSAPSQWVSPAKENLRWALHAGHYTANQSRVPAGDPATRNRLSAPPCRIMITIITAFSHSARTEPVCGRYAARHLHCDASWPIKLPLHHSWLIIDCYANKRCCYAPFHPTAKFHTKTKTTHDWSDYAPRRRASNAASPRDHCIENDPITQKGQG